MELVKEYGLEIYLISRAQVMIEIHHIFQWMGRNHVKREIENNINLFLMGMKKLSYILFYGLNAIAFEILFNKYGEIYKFVMNRLETDM